MTARERLQQRRSARVGYGHRDGPLERQTAHGIEQQVDLLVVGQVRGDIADARVQDLGVEHLHRPLKTQDQHHLPTL